MDVRERDGIVIEAEDGTEFVCDSYSSQGDFNFVSHAHADHALKQEFDGVVCSDLTEAIASARFDTSYSRAETERIEMFPSGHILGSTAALIDSSVLYTGDVSTRDGTYLDGFTPVDAETLVVETTYGSPFYTFPEQEVVESEISQFLTERSGPFFLFGYSLGKAQKIQHIVDNAGEFEVVAHGAVHSMNQVIERNTDLEFASAAYQDYEGGWDENTVFIAPPRVSQADFVEELAKGQDAVKAGFSGWAVSDKFKYRGGYDVVFPLSDHCDFDELVSLVRGVDPDKVYTTHGFAEEFARILSTEHGFDARALKSNQSSLSDF